jgi:ribonuclease VapC
MLVIDTSAIIAVLKGEREADRCIDAMAVEGDLLISAGSLAELLIVAATRGVTNELHDLLAELALDVVPVTAIEASLVGDAYVRWGRGFSPAGLNYGDCFAYVLAKQRDCPLLFVGDDFSQTDIRAA